jgi:hypothetical protein
MLQKTSRSISIAEIGIWLLILATGALLVLHLLGIGYFVVVTRPPGGRTAYLHGAMDHSYYESMRVYANTRGHHTHIGDPDWGAFWLWIPSDVHDPAVFFLAIADWVLAVPLIGCAYFCWRRSSRARTSSQTRCPICGYDLRAHKPGQKCPECGTEIPKFGWRSSKGDR